MLIGYSMQTRGPPSATKSAHIGCAPRFSTGISVRLPQTSQWLISMHSGVGSKFILNPFETKGDAWRVTGTNSISSSGDIAHRCLFVKDLYHLAKALLAKDGLPNSISRARVCRESSGIDDGSGEIDHCGEALIGFVA